jgi:sigma-B regulation protein RsbQ
VGRVVGTLDREAVRQRNNVKVWGRGSQAMIFAHGFGCDQNMWRWITPAFEDEYRIVVFDHVGAGQSDLASYSQAKYGSLNGYAADVLEICAAEDLTGAIFVGHSVSAMIGVLAAIQEPERFDRLILVCPSPRYLNDEAYLGGFGRQDIEGLLEFMAATIWVGPPQWPLLSWEIPTGPSSGQSSPAAFAAPIRILPGSLPG